MFDDNNCSNDDSCPNCGAQSRHQKADAHSEPPEWLGTGEYESCSLCGAENQHFVGEKIPLSKRSVGYLLQLLKQVESVYIGPKYMSDDDILKNRKYFQSIADVLAIVNKNHIPDRLEEWHRRQDIKRLISLYAKIHGHFVTKGLVKYSDFFYRFDDNKRSAFIEELKNTLAERQCKTFVNLPGTSK